MYIVNVHIHGWDTMEDLIHESLKCLCGISESKWHFHELEKSEGGGDSGLGNVFRGYGDLVVGSDEIELRKNGSTL